MGIDLEQQSGEHHKDNEEDRPDASLSTKDDVVDFRNRDGASTSAPRFSMHDQENAGRIKNTGHNSLVGSLMFMTDLGDLEPHDGMEFESKEDAFSFYKQYAKFNGFSAIIKASRRSRISGKFIDAKFVCTRYGNKRESTTLETPDSFPNTDSTLNTTVKRKRGRINTSWSKTDCKACMHVKKTQDGRWIIRNLIKEHNHEIIPDQTNNFWDSRNMDLGNGNAGELDAIRDRTKKMYLTMSRKSVGAKKIENKKDSSRDARRTHLALEEGDAQVILEQFLCMKDENPSFFYAIDLDQEQRLRNVFWVDAKGRLDYANFSDVVFFDTTYVKNEYKLPFVPFIGVNHHFHFLLLGCALIGDESKSTYKWLMQTWLRAMGGQAPKVILTDQDERLKEAISEIFKGSRHCFCLWLIVSKIQEKLGYVIRQHEKFVTKFNKCILNSVTEEQFEKRWRKLVDRFDLKNDLWIQSIYEDRLQWVPTYMKDIFLGGISSTPKLESIASVFDKCIQRKTKLKEFLDQYKSMLPEKYEDEAKAEFETWHKQPALKSPSPFEKQMATVYTHAIFKKFQVEVLGVVACHPKKEIEDGSSTTFKVQDFEECQDFIVLWNERTFHASCSCRLFEYNGFLCRHVLIVFQICGVHSIPSKYILKRWTKSAKDREVVRQAGLLDSRIQRYNDISQRILKLGDEGSLSLESYNIAFNALQEALRKCGNMNSSVLYEAEDAEHSSPLNPAVHEFEEVNQDNSSSKTTRGENIIVKGKVQLEQEMSTIGMHESWQQMGHSNIQALDFSYGSQESIRGRGKLNFRAPTVDSYFGTHQIVRAVGQLNTIAPNHDDYYGTEPMMQGLGQLNLIASIHDAQYITQQKLHAQGQMQFRPHSTQNCFGIQDASQDVDQSNMPNTLTSGMASKHLQL